MKQILSRILAMAIFFAPALSVMAQAPSQIVPAAQYYKGGQEAMYKFKDRFKFINAGINSHLAYNLFIRLDKVIKCSPAKITILIGTNDVNSSLSE